MSFVSVTDGFSASSSSCYYLYKDKKLANVLAYSVFEFYVKVPVHTFLRSENCHFPRFDLEVAHPQHATHCFMGLKQPRVPIINGRAIQIPQCWTKRSFNSQLHSYEDLENLNEFASYVILRYYPIIYGEEIVLPLDLPMYLRVKHNRWIEVILPNNKCLFYVI
jgi:hypothetical protein